MTTYQLPDLPYAVDALEPAISARLLELHHDKHHGAYVTGANSAVEKLAAIDPADVAGAQALRELLAFNVSGHVLHSLFWTCMTPGGSGEPTGGFATAVQRSFGSFERMKQMLGGAVSTIRGSGWAALVCDPLTGDLHVIQIHDHQSETIPGAAFLFAIDGWEHAYYLDYLNDKKAWLEAFWQVANWNTASDRYDAAMGALAVRH